VQFSWTDGAGGVTDHGALTGLADDDHPQYLLTNGSRGLTGNLGIGGFRLTGLGAATTNGDALRFEQGVKVGDAAGGDLGGTFPNAAVMKLRGFGVANTTPTAGQVLTWNGASSLWEPATPAAGGVTDHGALTGLGDDDHPQYVLVNGSHAMTGNLNMGFHKITNLLPGTTSDDAVRFDQAIKSGDLGQGDLGGSYPFVKVAKLQGTPIAMLAPVNGNFLKYDGTAWTPTAITLSQTFASNVSLLPGQASMIVTANCPSGMKAIGGGYTSASLVQVMGSTPDVNGGKWHVQFFNTTDPGLGYIVPIGSLTAYVVCLSGF
jgi:hypothetical protein